MNFFWIFLPSISTCSILLTILIFSAEKLVSNNSTKLSRAQLVFLGFLKFFGFFFRILKMNNILVFGFARTISILQKLSLKSNSIKKTFLKNYNRPKICQLGSYLFTLSFCQLSLSRQENSKFVTDFANVLNQIQIFDGTIRQFVKIYSRKSLWNQRNWR